MIQHIAIFQWKPDVSAELKETARRELASLGAIVPSLRSFRCGPDLEVSDTGQIDFAVVATFDDVAGWREYIDHPEHQRVSIQHVRPHVLEGALLQFEF